MGPIPVRLEQIACPPIGPAPMPADAGPAQRRGELSYAQHAKLKSRLYLRRGDGAELATIKLPSSTGSVTLSERGRIFLVDKAAEQVSELVEGECRPVAQASDGHQIVRLYVSGDTMWLSEGAKRRPGEPQVTPERIHRLVDEGERWRRTHSGTLPMKATRFAGTRELLVVLDSDGDVTACVPSPDDEAILVLGTRGKNFTEVAQWQGQVLALSHWERASAWVVTQAGAPSKAAAAAATRLEAFPADTREQMRRWLRDASNQAVHEALARVGTGGGLDSRRAQLRREGTALWSLCREDLVADFEEAFGVEVGPALASDLERVFCDAFEDAASW